jgi:hypothetical protein
MGQVNQLIAIPNFCHLCGSMKIAVLKERRPFEARRRDPETVKKYKALGYDVALKPEPALKLRFWTIIMWPQARPSPDSFGRRAGRADRLKVQRPMSLNEEMDEVSLIPSGALLIGMLNPYGARDDLASYASKNITAMSMELMPRITRAQVMDVLSSQSNLVAIRPFWMPPSNSVGVSHDDDGCGNGASGSRFRDGRRRRGASGHRHRQAFGRDRFRDGCSSGGERTGAKPRRNLCDG